MRSLKEVQKKNLYLTIYLLIKEGKNPAKICSILNIKKSALNYYIKRLKLSGHIKKIGYGTWEATAKQVQIQPLGTKTCLKEGSVCTSFLSDSIRSHAYQWTLKLPYVEGWNLRADFLKKKDIHYKPLRNNVFRIVFRGHKIWLSNKTITVYIKKSVSYFSDSPEDAYVMATNDFLDIVRGLEGVFGVSLRINKCFKFKCDKKHHSMIKNALAKQYAEKKSKLKIVDDSGLWLLADDSFNLNELEFVRTETNNNEAKIVQNFFNSLKEKPFTSDDLHILREAFVQAQKDATAQNVWLAENLKTHREVLDGMKEEQKINNKIQEETLNTLKAIQKSLNKR